MADAQALLAELHNLIRSGHWGRALALAETAPDTQLAWAERLTIARTMQNWVGVLNAVGAADAPAGGPATFERKPAEDHVTALVNLGLVREALEIATAQNTRFSGAGQFDFLRSRCYEIMGQPDQAISVTRAQWEAGRSEALQRLIALLLNQNLIPEAVEVLRQAQRAGTSLHSLAQMQHQIANARGDSGAARRALDRLAALEPQNTGGIARRYSQHAVRHNDATLQQQAWEAFLTWHDHDHGAWIEHGAIVLRGQWRFAADKASLTSYVEALEQQILPQTPALVLRDVMLQMGFFERCAKFLERMTQAFPASVSLWREALRLQARFEDECSRARLRRAIHSALPAQAAWDAICHNHMAAWAPEDLPRMIRHGYSTPVYRVGEMFKSDLQRMPRLHASARRALRDVAPKADSIDSLGLTFLAARHHQLTLWDKAETRILPYGLFEKARRDLTRDRYKGRARIIGEYRQQVGHTPGRSLIVQALVGLHDGASEAERNREPWYLHTAETLCDAVDAACWMMRRIQASVPTSVIRLGPGEGHFLPVPRNLHDMRAQDQRIMMEWWWNRDWPDAHRRRRVLTQFRTAVQRADMLGIVPESRILRIAQTPGKVLVAHRGHARVWAYTARHRNPGQAITSCLFQRDFTNWALWDDVLNALPLRRLCWIAPHDIAPYLSLRFAIATQDRILIPGEAKYSGLFDSRTAVPGTLIEKHEDILISLKGNRRGQVWLVAAGLLGKIYCDRIKKHGGIALDIGSLVDDWMGYATRSGQSDPGRVTPLSLRRITGLPDCLSVRAPTPPQQE